MGGLGDWMKSILLKSKLVVFISSLVFKTPIKSIKRRTGTMVSSGLMPVGTLQHLLPTLCANFQGNSFFTMKTQ
jgi:hypothetical protein